MKTRPRPIFLPRPLFFFAEAGAFFDVLPAAFAEFATAEAPRSWDAPNDSGGRGGRLNSGTPPGRALEGAVWPPLMIERRTLEGLGGRELEGSDPMISSQFFFPSFLATNSTFQLGLHSSVGPEAVNLPIS